MLFRTGIKTVLIMMLIGMACMIMTPGYAAVREIKSVRVWPSADSTRVVLDLPSEIKYHAFTLDSPHRVVIDIQEGHFKGKIDQTSLADSLIRKIRYAQNSPTVFRFVLETEHATKIHSFILPPNEGGGYRLVVDLSNSSAASKSKPSSPAASSKPSVSTESSSDKKVTSQPAPAAAASDPVKLTTREFLVAIDAGHGGKDTGAIGRHLHLREKDVVLAVAKKLESLINAKNGMRAYLVRNGDYFIPLRKRMDLARSQGADLFVSVHADSFNNPQASGASVFVLSEKGASNEASRWLAERENRADLVGGIKLEDKGDLLASVLLDLSQTASQTASYELAGHIITQLGKITDLHHNTVQHAGFVVLKSPDIPSVLVELGFLSNQVGEQKLGNTTHQLALAKALFAGVNAYASKRPMPVKHPNDFTVAKKANAPIKKVQASVKRA